MSEISNAARAAAMIAATASPALATSMAAASASSVHLMMRRSSGSGSLPTTKLTAESATQPSTEMARSRETRSPSFRL